MARDIYNISSLGRAPRKFRFIIIHDTNCQWKDYQPFKIDKNTYQSGPMRSRFKIMKNFDEMPYHFLCEKMGDNYQTIIGRPLQYSCVHEYPDMDALYSEFGIHVCLLGNYNNMVATDKLYQQLAYRVICPMMRTFRIVKSNIYLHAEITKNSDYSDCPGFNFRKDLLLSFMHKYMVGVSG